MSATHDILAPTDDAALDDEQVRQYLKSHSDFLQRHPDMLVHLHVTHASGSAVSLVEKQVSVLRERNMELRHRLNALTANARDNDKLYERTRKLVLRLLEADSVGALCEAFMTSMKEDFEIEHASILLYGDPGATSGNLRYETPEKVKLEIGSLLKGRKPLCGVMRREELNFLFLSQLEQGSAAIMPLRSDDRIGLIAVGSANSNHYHPGMGTLFLQHIAEVLVRLLERPPASAN
ncbi:MAG: DUF484 family protein [Parahaliea sp.]